MNIFNEALFTACACPSDGYVSPRPIPLEAPVTTATGCWVVFIECLSGSFSIELLADASQGGSKAPVLLTAHLTARCPKGQNASARLMSRSRHVRLVSPARGPRRALRRR
jgi:hypothetical protein